MGGDAVFYGDVEDPRIEPIRDMLYEAVLEFGMPYHSTHPKSQLSSILPSVVYVLWCSLSKSR